jgi:hypothetical protein
LADHKFVSAGLNVKGNYQRFRILVFVLLILTSISPAYFQRDGIGNVFFLSPNMILENSEDGSPEDLILDPPAQSKGIFSAPLGNIVLLGLYPFKSIFSYLFQGPVFEPKAAILRC